MLPQNSPATQHQSPPSNAPMQVRVTRVSEVALTLRSISPPILLWCLISAEQQQQAPPPQSHAAATTSVADHASLARVPGSCRIRYSLLDRCRAILLAVSRVASFANVAASCFDIGCAVRGIGMLGAPVRYQRFFARQHSNYESTFLRVCLFV